MPSPPDASAASGDARSSPEAGEPPLPSPPRVTVVIPTQDEESDLVRALEAVANQDVPIETVELIVVDGGSTDGTIAGARAALDGRGFARAEVLENPGGSTPSNLNVGLASARGRYLCRIDARSIVPESYLRKCTSTLEQRQEVIVTGGSQVARPRDASAVAVGIARALNNRWGMGLARYRRGAASGPADTVYLGAFRTQDLRSAGGWDERFATNQDFELNRRLGREGTIWFHSDLHVGYLPRTSVAGLFAQYQRFGSWKVRYWRTTGDRPRLRQLAILAAPPFAALAMVVAARRGPGAALGTVAAATVGATLVEVVGADEPGAGVRGHMVAIVALGAVAGGWTSGVWDAVLRRRRDGVVTPG